MASAISTPSALQVLALPLLHKIARAYPSSTWARVTAIGAPWTRLVVYTQAAAAGRSLRIKARSFFTLFLRMPQCTPAAVNPFAAQTPPGMVFIGDASLFFLSMALHGFLQIQAFRFIQPQHDVHTLQGRSRSPFAQVIETGVNQ